MGLFSRNRPAVLEPPTAAAVLQGMSADDVMMAKFEANAAEWAQWLTPYINQGLEMIRTGRRGEVKTKRHKGVTYSVSVASREIGVCVRFYGYRDGWSIQRHIASYYTSLGYSVEKGTADEDDMWQYNFFVQP